MEIAGDALVLSDNAQSIYLSPRRTHLYRGGGSASESFGKGHVESVE